MLGTGGCVSRYQSPTSGDLVDITFTAKKLRKRAIGFEDDVVMVHVMKEEKAVGQFRLRRDKQSVTHQFHSQQPIGFILSEFVPILGNVARCQGFQSITPVSGHRYQIVFEFEYHFKIAEPGICYLDIIEFDENNIQIDSFRQYLEPQKGTMGDEMVVM